jgi:hypothetical protein
MFLFTAISCSKSTCPQFEDSGHRKLHLFQGLFAGGGNRDAFVGHRQNRRGSKQGDGFALWTKRNHDKQGDGFALWTKRNHHKQGDGFALWTRRNHKKQSDAFTSGKRRSYKTAGDGFTRKQKRHQKKLDRKANGKKIKEKKFNLHFIRHWRSKREKDREKDPLNGHPQRKKRQRKRKPQKGLWDKKMY